MRSLCRSLCATECELQAVPGRASTCRASPSQGGTAISFAPSTGSVCRDSEAANERALAALLSITCLPVLSLRRCAPRSRLIDRMVRLDLAPAADDDAALFDLPTTTLDSAAAPVSSSESSSDDDEGPSALSTLAARQSELVREREQREADLKCVLRSQTTACCRRSCSCGSSVLPKALPTQRRLARQRKESRRERDARAKAAKAVVAVPSPSPSDEHEPDEPVASTSAAPRSIARLPSSVFAEASASIEAARLEAKRADQLEREAAAQSERHRRAKRRRLDEAPQPGSARDLGCVLRT